MLLIRPELLEKMLVVQPSLSHADAIVVMAGSRTARLPIATELFHQHVAPRVLLTNDGIFSSWSPQHDRNLYQVEWAREELLAAGVPEEAIVMLDFSNSGSYFDALHTRNYVLQDDSIRSLLVVTSDYHTRRTLWTFNRLFSGTGILISTYPVPKDPVSQGQWLRVNTIELVKLVYYWLRYGVLAAFLPPAFERFRSDSQFFSTP